MITLRSNSYITGEIPGRNNVWQSGLRASGAQGPWLRARARAVTLRLKGVQGLQESFGCRAYARVMSLCQTWEARALSLGVGGTGLEALRSGFSDSSLCGPLRD